MNKLKLNFSSSVDLLNILYALILFACKSATSELLVANRKGENESLVFHYSPVCLFVVVLLVFENNVERIDYCGSQKRCSLL